MSDPITLVYQFKGQKAQMRLVTDEAFALLYADLITKGARVLIDVSQPKKLEKAA